MLECRNGISYLAHQLSWPVLCHRAGTQCGARRCGRRAAHASTPGSKTGTSRPLRIQKRVAVRCVSAHPTRPHLRTPSAARDLLNKTKNKAQAKWTRSRLTLALFRLCLAVTATVDGSVAGSVRRTAFARGSRHQNDPGASGGHGHLPRRANLVNRPAWIGVHGVVRVLLGCCSGARSMVMFRNSDFAMRRRPRSRWNKQARGSNKTGNALLIPQWVQAVAVYRAKSVFV